MRRFTGIIVGVTLTLFVAAAGTVSFATGAGATTGVTFYVNSTSDNTSVSDCTTMSNVDCGIDNAISAFNADTSSNDNDAIAFGSSLSPYESSDTAIDNSTTGVTLAIVGNGSGETAVSGGNSNTVFTIDADTVSMSNLTIEDGNDSTSAGGGGVDNESGALTLNNDIFTSDSDSNGSGGAVLNLEGTTATDGDTFSNDSESDGLGGAVGNIDGTFTAYNDTFADDSENGMGNAGGIFTNGGTVTVDNDTFSDDSAGGDGGAIFEASGPLVADNDTFVGDSVSGDGGAIFYNGAGLTVNDDTFSDDSASSGDGIYSDSGGDTVANSIFDAAGCDGTIIDGGYNVESDDSCGFGASDVVNSASINLSSALAANGAGGPETLAIGSTSSAFEEVPSASCSITTDERGDSRPGVTGQSNCDAGAFEYQYTSPASSQVQSQSITFEPISSMTLGVAPFGLSATATSGLTVASTSTTSSVCTVSGTMVSLLSVGTCSITASQAGNADYSPATSVTVSFAVKTATLARPRRPVIRATSPFKGRVRITLASPARGATSYQYSLDGRAWRRLVGSGPFTLSRVAHVVRIRLRGANASGYSPSSNSVRVLVKS